MYCEAPEVKVSNVQFTAVESRAIQLTWDEVSCSQRLGLQPRYDILAIESISLAVTVNTSTNTSPPYWLYTLQPYTEYTVRVRYANEYGAAAYSDDVQDITKSDGKSSSINQSINTLF